MQKPLSISLSVMLILAASGCVSQQPVISQCPVNPSPPAWMMQDAPDLLTPLSGIISPSESASKPSQSN